MDMHGSQLPARDQLILPPAAVGMPRLSHDRTMDKRTVAEECPIALVYDGSTLAVVMATPADLTDLAIGFSLTEGIVRNIDEIEELNVVPCSNGIELRIWLRRDRGGCLRERRRRLVGPTGCGLCGIESLDEAARIYPAVSRHIFLTPVQIGRAIDALVASQHLNHETRATHAAGFYPPDGGAMISREDVGRHNALDKLAGALAIENISGSTGAVVLTSRVSVEMVQKTAAIGAAILVAISAPTALAVRTAERCGITLVGVARGREFEIFNHPGGIALY
jgi:FdhD protein